MPVKAAQDLARRRWSAATEEDRAEAARIMHAGRRVKLTPEQRSELARNAAITRWSKKKKGKAK